MKRYDGKVALITGAASGIGFATAKAFAQQGAHVILSDYAEGPLNEACAKLASEGLSVEAAQLDVTDADAAKALATAINAKHGAIHILVNNAGIGFTGTFEEHDPAIWRRIFEVNLFGVMNCLHAFLPAMRAAGDKRHIVNIASGAAVSPVPNMTAYASSKAAVRNLSEVYAMELQGSNVQVHIVYPGIINTPIANPHMFGPSASEAQKARLVNFYRTKGVLPETVAAAIVKGVDRGTQHIFTGPLALSGAIMGRISPRLGRFFSIKSAREIGFIE